MKFSLAAQFLSPAFAAAIASPSSVSVAEVLAKKYDNRYGDIDATAAATSRAVPSRNLDYSIHTTSTSKSSKSSSSTCPPKPTPDVQCGNVYVDSTVILGENLSCNGNITQADESNNAVLLLKGEKALLDCKGHTISQTTDGSAAAMDCPIFPSDAASILRMKKECGFFYLVGVKLEDGASMVNCNIQKFYVGGAILNEGEIKDSEFSLNRRGVQIVNNDDAANTVSKVANR